MTPGTLIPVPGVSLTIAAPLAAAMTFKTGPAITIPMRFTNGRRGRKVIESSEEAPPQTVGAGRVPRVAKLMALAIRFEQYIQSGAVADYAEIARVGHVTRARITQITNLLHLALDIQEAILNLPRVVRGRDTITERDLRPIVAVIDWTTQRRLWQGLVERTQMHGGVATNVDQAARRKS